MKNNQLDIECDRRGKHNRMQRSLQINYVGLVTWLSVKSITSVNTGRESFISCSQLLGYKCFVKSDPDLSFITLHGGQTLLKS